MDRARGGDGGRVPARASGAARAVTVQTFPVPSGAANLSDIVAGPDGALWFTENGTNKVGRITTAGQITEYPVPNLASGLPDTGPTLPTRRGRLGEPAVTVDQSADQGLCRRPYEACRPIRPRCLRLLLSPRC